MVVKAVDCFFKPKDNNAALGVAKLTDIQVCRLLEVTPNEILGFED